MAIAFSPTSCLLNVSFCLVILSTMHLLPTKYIPNFAPNFCRLVQQTRTSRSKDGQVEWDKSSEVSSYCQRPAEQIQASELKTQIDYTNPAANRDPKAAPSSFGSDYHLGTAHNHKYYHTDGRFDTNYADTDTQQAFN